MLYYSTSKNSVPVNFKEAVIQGLAPDKGLYFPEQIPLFSPHFLEHFKSYSKEELAFEIISPYVGDCIPKDVLMGICAETVNFDFPLVPITESIYSLELFHGPTLAFKDVGARFLSRCLQYFCQEDKQKTTILVATSGDTGGAVANSFLQVENTQVVILYPSQKVSEIQELQLTTLGHNILALEVKGDFDDCQRMVKTAFADTALNQHMILSSANSINIARWLSQQFYYAFAMQQWQHDGPPVFAVPSGNFGNICAGILARLSGLPTDIFVAACNSNDAFYDYYVSGTYHAKPSIATISNAMDVGNPSNIPRLFEMYKQDYASIKKNVFAASIDEASTKATLQKVFEQEQYILDPHGAVAYAGLEKYLALHPNKKGIILETAHPIKFKPSVEPLIHQAIEVPVSVQHLFGAEKKNICIEANDDELKVILYSL